MGIAFLHPCGNFFIIIIDYITTYKYFLSPVYVLRMILDLGLGTDEN